MSQLCFQNLRYDVRLMDQLRSYELRHFLILLDFAADLRDPTFIPARKREALRLTLRFGSGDNGKAALAARLGRFEALDLIEVNPDRSISITYLIDQEIDGGDDFPAPASPLPSGPVATDRRSAPDLRSGFDRRQPGRTYSTDPAAVRQRERRKQLAESEGLAPKVVTFGENVTENVTGFESKRHATGPQPTPEMSQQNVTENVTNERDISASSLAGVSPNVNVSNKEDYKIISDSGDVSNVAAKTSQPEMSQNVTGQNVTPGPRVPVRPGYEEVDRRAQMMRDVEKVIALAKDGKSRGFYIKVWKHCYANNSLACWDMAAEILTDKIATEARLGPPPGQPGHFPSSAYGKSLNKTLMNLLRDNGTPFEEGSAADRDEARRQIQESLGSGITPLEDIMPEMEDE